MIRLDLLRRVAAGALSPEEALAELRAEGIAEIRDVARLDSDRAERSDVPEVVLAGVKRPAELAVIVATLLDTTGSACVSRMRAGHRRAVESAAARAGAVVVPYGRTSARVMVPGAVGAGTGADEPADPPAGLVGLIAAGTGDVEALSEARMVCDAAGCATRTVVDVGVAGLHRLFEPLAELVAAGVDAIVVAAGMDGALPSVVAGLAAAPVIGLPTSTGYGAGGRGEAALLAMLQSCAPGLCVVNIDNGVGAGAAAARIALGRGRRLASRPLPGARAGRAAPR